MNAKKFCASVVAMALLVFSAMSVNVLAGDSGNQKDKPDVSGFEMNQNIGFGEVVGGTAGIYVTGGLFDLGPFVNETTGNELMAYGEPVDVLANWSDDLVLHQFKAGSKIRTEVILWDFAHQASVFTIRAHFMIQEINPETGAVLKTVWEGTVAEGLWADGPTDAYSAEVNQLGQLLFGYNWDTRILDCKAGTYRLTFSIGSALPDNVPYENTEVQGITITGVDDVSTDVTDVYSSSSSTWIEMTLLPGGGR
ncbi:MAG: hypothetical protein IH630_07810 [Thermoplasmata archaeon]|nr:hypothetical protein [Thermoplasmata archaeon]TFG69763.1 MAG: hypothetical protein E4H25_04060 [Methanomassiliicoccus sp.]